MKTVFSLLVCVITMLVLRAQDSAVIYYRLAAKQYDLRMYKEAEASIDKSVRLHRTDSAYAVKAKLSYKDKTKERAYLDTAITLQANNMRNYMLRGNANTTSDDIDRDTLATLAYFEQAILLAPDSAEPYRRKGRVLFALGKYNEAIDNYTKAFKLDNDTCQLLRRGTIHFWNKNYTAALNDYQLVYNSCAYGHPQEYATMQIALCKWHLGDTTFACSFLAQKALYLSEKGKGAFMKYCVHDKATMYYWQGLIDADNGSIDLARRCFTTAIQLSPSDSAYIGRARTWKEPERATLDLDSALMLNPKNWYAILARANEYSRAKNYKKAEVEFNRAIGMCPDSVNGYSQIGYMYFMQKKYKQAIEYLNKAIDIKKDVADLYLWRAMALHNLGNYAEALADFNRGESLKPSKYNLEFLYGGKYMCKKKLGDTTGACEELYKAAKLGNKSAIENYKNECGL